MTEATRQLKRQRLCCAAPTGHRRSGPLRFPHPEGGRGAAMLAKRKARICHRKRKHDGPEGPCGRALPHKRSLREGRKSESDDSFLQFHRQA